MVSEVYPVENNENTTNFHFPINNYNVSANPQKGFLDSNNTEQGIKIYIISVRNILAEKVN